MPVSDTQSEASSIWSYARIYGLGAVLNRLGALLLIPLYTTVLEPGEFGLYIMVVVVADAAAVFLSRGLQTAMVRTYLQSPDHSTAGATISTAIVSYCGLAIIFVAITSQLAEPISRLVFSTPEHVIILRIAFLNAAVAILFELLLGYYRARKQPWTILWISAIKSTFLIVINAVLLLHFKLGVMGILIGTVATLGMLSALVTVRVLADVGLSFSWVLLKDMARFAVPIIPAKLADVSTQFVDKYFINLFLTTASVGTYGLAHRLASTLAAFVAGPFAQIWIVRRLESGDDPDQDAIFRHVFTQFMSIMVAIALALSLFAPEIISIISDQSYTSASALVPVLVIAFALMPMDTNLQTKLIAENRGDLLMITSFIAAAVNIAAVYFLVQRFDSLGAAVALIITNSCRVWVLAMICRFYYAKPASIRWSRFVVVVLGALICYRLMSGTNYGNSGLAGIGAKGLALTIYCFAAWPIVFSVDRGFLRYFRNR